MYYVYFFVYIYFFFTKNIFATLLNTNLATQTWKGFPNILLEKIEKKNLNTNLTTRTWKWIPIFLPKITWIFFSQNIFKNTFQNQPSDANLDTKATPMLTTVTSNTSKMVPYTRKLLYMLASTLAGLKIDMPGAMYFCEDM